ncbi:MAG TPA: cupin domain-containing protein [Gaiellaceae bacterium]|nr:cupin domain-containing protein [Gaiellaceae bacterium]
MIPPLDDSALALDHLSLARFAKTRVGHPDADTLVYVASGLGAIQVGETGYAFEPGMAALVPVGEEGSLVALDEGIELLVVTVGSTADVHAPMGPRTSVVKPAGAGAQQATGSRSFQILFGPHNGSTRATLFVGFIPPGKAPWHYHLYDEIVWVPEGPGRLHIGETTEELGPGSAFRLRPRQVHIVENLSDSEVTIIGVFTPAGSPSAAYLEPGVAAEYRFAD